MVKGYHLTNNDVTIIILSILLCVTIIVTIVMVDIYTLFWTRIGWFFEAEGALPPLRLHRARLFLLHDFRLPYTAAAQKGDRGMGIFVSFHKSLVLMSPFSLLFRYIYERARGEINKNIV